MDKLNKFWWNNEQESCVLYAIIWNDEEQIATLTKDNEDDDEVYILSTSYGLIEHMDGEYIFSSLEEAKESVIEWLIESAESEIECNQKYLEVFKEKEENNFVVEQKEHSILGQVGYCPHCNRTIHYISCEKFCGHCGKEIKWNLK